MAQEKALEALARVAQDEAWKAAFIRQQFLDEINS